MLKRLPTILDFFSGLFVGVGVGGGVFVFYIVYWAFELIFLALLAGVLCFCVFVFFGIVAKALSILLRNHL